MIDIYDLSDCPFSNRHGTYGGAAGDKDGILINGEYWIVKYPKPQRELSSNMGMLYTTSPLSEYLGSHIYDLLGFSVHETILGIRNDKVVVGCKDFCQFRGQLTEMKTIKNGANKQLEKILDQEMHHSSSGDRVNLNELLLHLDYNPILQLYPEVKKRFWQTIVVDIFIDNNDRNNGNWGLLFNEKEETYTLAPIYDNGNSFSNKTNDERLEEILSYSEKERIDMYTGLRTAYDYNGHILSAKKLIKMDIPELKDAILKLTPIIYHNMNNIINLIDNIPEKVGDKIICSDIRKEYYKQSLTSRFERIIYPEYKKIKNIDIGNAVDHLKFQDSTRYESSLENEDYDEEFDR